jgi:hypothetical protein
MFPKDRGLKPRELEASELEKIAFITYTQITYYGRRCLARKKLPLVEFVPNVKTC